MQAPEDFSIWSDRKVLPADGMEVYSKAQMLSCYRDYELPEGMTNYPEIVILLKCNQPVNWESDESEAPRRAEAEVWDTKEHHNSGETSPSRGTPTTQERSTGADLYYYRDSNDNQSEEPHPWATIMSWISSGFKTSSLLVRPAGDPLAEYKPVSQVQEARKARARTFPDTSTTVSLTAAAHALRQENHVQPPLQTPQPQVSKQPPQQHQQQSGLPIRQPQHSIGVRPQQSPNLMTAPGTFALPPTESLAQRGMPPQLQQEELHWTTQEVTWQSPVQYQQQQAFQRQQMHPQQLMQQQYASVLENDRLLNGGHLQPVPASYVQQLQAQQQHQFISQDGLPLHMISSQLGMPPHQQQQMHPMGMVPMLPLHGESLHQSDAGDDMFWRTDIASAPTLQGMLPVADLPPSLAALAEHQPRPSQQYHGHLVNTLAALGVASSPAEFQHDPAVIAAVPAVIPKQEAIPVAVNTPTQQSQPVGQQQTGHVQETGNKKKEKAATTQKSAPAPQPVPQPQAQPAAKKKPVEPVEPATSAPQPPALEPAVATPPPPSAPPVVDEKAAAKRVVASAAPWTKSATQNIKSASLRDIQNEQWNETIEQQQAREAAEAAEAFAEAQEAEMLRVAKAKRSAATVVLAGLAVPGVGNLAVSAPAIVPAPSTSLRDIMAAEQQSKAKRQKDESSNQLQQQQQQQALIQQLMQEDDQESKGKKSKADAKKQSQPSVPAISEPKPVSTVWGSKPSAVSTPISEPSKKSDSKPVPQQPAKPPAVNSNKQPPQQSKQAVVAAAVVSSPTVWSSAAGPPAQKKSASSLRDIQAEQQQTGPPIHHTPTAASITAQSNPSNKSESRKLASLGASDDTFWTTDLSETSGSKVQPQVKQKPSKPQPKATTASEPQINAADSAELESWTRNQLTTIKKKGNLDVSIIISALIVGTSDEVRMYATEYLGNSKAVSTFVDQFLEMKSFIKTDSGSSSPAAQKIKDKKKAKGRPMNSLLTFTVADSDRINRGEIEKAD